MEFSVKKRLSKVLADKSRSQALAGILKEYVDNPNNIYEYSLENLGQKFTPEIYNNIFEFFKKNISSDERYGETAAKASNPHLSGDDMVMDNTPFFIRFNGYLDDIDGYRFNVGYRSKNQGEVFVFRFDLSSSGILANWKSSSAI